MLILIAESKTMAPAIPVSAPAETRPLFEGIADDVAARLRMLSLPELASELKLGPKAAETAFKDYYDFPDKSTGRKSIEAFTGVVFRNLDFRSLPASGADFIMKNVRIISSAYGILLPSDIVKSYRLDFNSKVMPGLETPMRFWRNRITDMLAAEAATRPQPGAILNLLPKDAEACIDMKRLATAAPTINIDFKIQDGEELHTPPAGRLKAMRGLLLREIAKRGIDTHAGLTGIETDDFAYCPELSAGGNIVFIGV